MKVNISILLIEDSDVQTQKIIGFLKKEGYDPVFQCINNRNELIEYLDSGKWDVILSDYDHNRLNAVEALSIIQKKDIDIPFIVLSDSIGEERAVEIMHAGANYCLPRGKIGRLASIIQKEMYEARIRKENVVLFENIERAKKEWEASVDAIQEIIILTDVDGKIIRVNERAIHKFETTYLDLIGTEIQDLFSEIAPNFDQDIQFFGEIQIPDIEGWFDVASYPIYLDDDLHGIAYLLKDITDRKIIEQRFENFNYLSGFGSLVSNILDDEIFLSIRKARENIEEIQNQINLKNISEDDIKMILRVTGDILNKTEENAGKISKWVGEWHTVKEEYDLNEIIVETLNLIHHRIEPDVEIIVKTNLQSDLPLIFCDADQIILALLNAIQMSIETLTESGVIDINSLYHAEKEAISIYINDRGNGLSKEQNKNEIFTSNMGEIGKNSGDLRFQISKKIIEMHGGNIYIDTDRETGMSITIYLPCK